jgi:hypothetical protein
MKSCMWSINTRRCVSQRLCVLTASCVFAMTGVIGCSGVASQPDLSPPSEAESAAVSYSLYLNRSSLTAQEFEQYRELPQGLFTECGTVYRGRAEVRQQGIEQPASSARMQLKAQAIHFFERLRSADPPHLDSPGTGAGFADPGKFTLVIARGADKVEVRTSLDWVERAQTTFSKDLKSFAQQLRGALSKAPCGNHEFYGIARAQ